MQCSLLPDAASAALPPASSPAPSVSAQATGAFNALVDALSNVSPAPDVAVADAGDVASASGQAPRHETSHEASHEAMSDARLVAAMGVGVSGPESELDGDTGAIATTTGGSDADLEDVPDQDSGEGADATTFVAVTEAQQPAPHLPPPPPSRVSSMDSPDETPVGTALKSMPEPPQPVWSERGAPVARTRGEVPVQAVQAVQMESGTAEAVTSVATGSAPPEDLAPSADSGATAPSSAPRAFDIRQAAETPTPTAVPNDTPMTTPTAKASPSQKEPISGLSTLAEASTKASTEASTDASPEAGGPAHARRMPDESRSSTRVDSGVVTPMPASPVLAPGTPQGTVPTATPSAVSAGPTPETPTTDDGQPVSARVVETLTLQHQQGGGRAEIRLRPEWMGPITVSLRMDNGEVTAVVRAESAAAVDHLVAETEHLRSALEARGLQLSSFEVRREAVHERDPREQRRRQSSTPSRHRARNDRDKVFEVVV